MKKLDFKLISSITEKLYYSSPKEDWHKCDVVIILGSSACEYRVARAWEIFCDKKVKYVVCGGNPSVYKDDKDIFYNEANFMRKYLLDKGVNNELIVCETDSVNTFENLKNAFGLLIDDCIGSIGIISAGFHMTRVKSLTKKLQVPYDIVFIPAYGEHTRKDNWFLNDIGLQIVTTEYEKGEKSHEKD